MRYIWICVLLFLATVMPGQIQPKHSKQSSSRMQSAQVSRAPEVQPFASINARLSDGLHKLLKPVANVGGWIDQRRALLVAASIANPLWWYSVTMTFATVILLWIVNVLRENESRKIWKAAEAHADVWNWAVHCERKAKEAIAKHNEHVAACNRLAEIELSGKPLPSELAKAEATSELTKTRNELELMTKENQRFKEQLAERESEIALFNTRIAELSTRVPSNEGPQAMPPSRLNAELTARINQLTMEKEELVKQLLQERNRNNRTKGAADNDASDTSRIWPSLGTTDR